MHIDNVASKLKIRKENISKTNTTNVYIWSAYLESRIIIYYRIDWDTSQSYKYGTNLSLLLRNNPFLIRYDLRWASGTGWTEVPYSSVVGTINMVPYHRRKIEIVLQWYRGTLMKKTSTCFIHIMTHFRPTSSAQIRRPIMHFTSLRSFVFCYPFCVMPSASLRMDLHYVLIFILNACFYNIPFLEKVIIHSGIRWIFKTKIPYESMLHICIYSIRVGHG